MAKAAMEVKLIVVGGKASSREISLKLPSTIGRSREADLTVAHPMVSRRHCELFENSGLLMVRDLGSLNGTFVGEQQVGEAPLPPDTNFTIGPLTFAARYDYSGDLSSLPAVVPPSKPAKRRETAEAADKETPAAQRAAKTEPITPPAAAPSADEELEDLDLAEPLDLDAEFELEDEAAVDKVAASAADDGADIEDFALAPDDDEPVVQPAKKPAVANAKPAPAPKPKPKPATAEKQSAGDPEEDAFNDFLQGLQ